MGRTCALPVLGLERKKEREIGWERERYQDRQGWEREKDRKRDRVGERKLG